MTKYGSNSLYFLMDPFADAGWPQDISLWIFVSNLNAGYEFDRASYTVCNKGVTNFTVPKGYSITFGNVYKKKKMANLGVIKLNFQHIEYSFMSL